MARLQYKVCTNPSGDGDGYLDVLVFMRQCVDGGEWSSWKLIATRRPYVDPTLHTHGQRLKALLRSLA